jgi:GntR family transcriptional regulator / MocR family aminotransferase
LLSRPQVLVLVDDRAATLRPPRDALGEQSPSAGGLRGDDQVARPFGSHPIVALRVVGELVETVGQIGQLTVADAGGSHVPIAIDQDGLRTDALRDSPAEMAVCAPAHQFPLGVMLSSARRAELLAWARATGLVVEDDYDAEFRYGRQPIGALQGLAPEHVAYVGSVSKTLAPALRLGWIVAPQSMLERLVETKRRADAGSPTLDQLALAQLLGRGVYERQLRRVRRRYRRQRDRLLDALREHMPGAEISGAAAGLHVMLTLPPDTDSLDVVAAAAGRDLALAALERYTLTPGAGRRALVLGYGNVAAGALDEAVKRLAEATADARQR